jgi:uncharacterized protein YecE (DUF72 family)
MNLTADFVFCRPHGAEQLYASRYSHDALDLWATVLQPGQEEAGSSTKRKYKTIAARDAYVYFDKDMKVRAPFDAKNLRDRVERRLATNRTGGLSLESR